MKVTISLIPWRRQYKDSDDERYDEQEKHTHDEKPEPFENSAKEIPKPNG
jgi:hypothetical protein